MKKITAAAVLAVLPLTAGPTAAQAGSGVTVAITDRVAPAEVTVAPGATVVWRNDDADRHRVRSVEGPDEFDSGDLATGERFSFTFTREGTYSYVDHRDDDNPAYHGTVVVRRQAPGDAGATSPRRPGPGSPAARPAGAGSASVRMAGRAFTPRSVTVGAGGTVTWTNDDDRAHTVTGDAFDSGLVEPGGTYRRTFPTPGTFSYLCLVHPDMVGTVTVSGAGRSPSGAAPADEGEPSRRAGAARRTPAPTPATDPSAADVEISDFRFSPARVVVDTGSTVRWVNTGRAPHTVTSDDSSFDSGMLQPGAGFAETFREPGTFGYLCALHPQMTATVVVRAGGSAAPVAGSDASGDDAVSVAEAGAEDPGGDTEAAEGGAAVDVVDFAFAPDTVEVTVGTEVVWTLAGQAPHTVTADGGLFDSGILHKGAVFRHRFDNPGTIAYRCALHPQMVGRVEVVAAGAASGEAADLTFTSETARSSTGQPPPWLVVVLVLAIPAVMGYAGLRLYREADRR